MWPGTGLNRRHEDFQAFQAILEKLTGFVYSPNFTGNSSTGRESFLDFKAEEK